MNIYIGGFLSDYSAMQGPCPDGFHVPLITEWEGLITIMGGLNLTTGNDWKINLHMPFAGYRNYSSASLSTQNSYGNYWSSSPNVATPTYARILYLNSSYANVKNNDRRASGLSVRCFKDSYVEPTSSWIVVQGTLGSAGIFWNQSEGLISITNGTTGYTIMDKNLGATTVYNSGDTLSQANKGNMYQWGNNYGFPSTGSVSKTSSTQVNAQNYGPGNYYSSDTFITGSNDWSSVRNDNLRGGETGVKPGEVKNIYIGEYKNPERIEYKMNADSSGNLYVPLSGFNTSAQRSCSYNWKISVDGGAETTYSGTSSYGSSITLSGYTAGTSHTIKIVPTTEGYQWARAYSWQGTSGATYITDILYDSSYMGYAVSATDTGAYFRAVIYSGCTNLLKPAEEYLPDSVTTIGNAFRASEYTSCSRIAYTSEEVLPSSVTSIGTNFRSSQYSSCTALTQIKGWKDLSIGNSTQYRVNQFLSCTSNKTVKVLSNVGYSAYNDQVLDNTYVTSVSVPSAYLTTFKNTTNNPWYGITDSKFIGY